SVLSPGSCASTGAASSAASAAVDSISAFTRVFDALWPGSGAAVVAREDGSGISVSLAFGWRSFRSTAAASCVERYAGVSAGALRSSAYEAGASAPTSVARLVMMVLLGREVSQFVELGLGKLAVVGNDHEMVLDQAEDLHREPQPLTGIGVTGRRVAPSGDVVGLDLSKDLFEQLTAEQLLGARAAGDPGLELVVGHLKRPSEPRMPPRRRLCAPRRLAALVRCDEFTPDRVRNAEHRSPGGGRVHGAALLFRDGRHAYSSAHERCRRRCTSAFTRVFDTLCGIHHRLCR